MSVENVQDVSFIHEDVVSMQGTVVGVSDDGERIIADMSHPAALPGVELLRSAMCFTKTYENPGARVRIRDLHCPAGTTVEKGERVAAVVSRVTQESGTQRTDRWGYSSFTPREVTKSGQATKWGKFQAQQ